MKRQWRISSLLCVASAFLASPAWSLDLSTMTSVYIENFDGETGPLNTTSPELDLRGVGSLIQQHLGNGPPPYPSPAGNVLPFSPGPTAGPVVWELQGAQAGMTHDWDVAVRADFVNPAVVMNGKAMVSVDLGISSSSNPNDNVVAVGQIIILQDVFGVSGEWAFLQVIEFDFGAQTLVGQSTFTPLTSTARAAIISGGKAFRMDLRIDRSAYLAHVAYASLEVDGESFGAMLELSKELRSIGVTELVGVTSQLANCEDLQFSGNCNTVGNNSTGGDDSIDVDVDRIEIFVGGPEVPTLAPGALGFLALVLGIFGVHRASGLQERVRAFAARRR